MKVYIQERRNIVYPIKFKVFGSYPFRVIFGPSKEVIEFLENNKDIVYYQEELDSVNELYEYPLISKYKARIEKGAIIRDDVKIDDTSIILMGAILNKGSSIGSNTMIDMNAVIGSGAIIKNNVHISAGVVISGVMEPLSSKPVIIEDNVFIGANSVISEGVHIKKNAIIGAMSFVTHDVEENEVYYGIPAKKVREVTKLDRAKLSLNQELRK